MTVELRVGRRHQEAPEGNIVDKLLKLFNSFYFTYKPKMQKSFDYMKQPNLTKVNVQSMRH